MNKTYQEIDFIYKSQPVDGLNYENDVNIKLTNDYSLNDIFNAFIDFIPCIGFNLTKKETIDLFKVYIDEKIEDFH